MAQTLGLSPSYLNQLEQNQRPLTVSVLLKISAALGINLQQFSDDEEARLVVALQEVLADAPRPITLPELRELATQMPVLAEAVLALHQRYAQTLERADSLAMRLGEEGAQAGQGDRIVMPRAMPFEAVRDFFFARKNHVDPLDRAAQALAQQLGGRGTHLVDALVNHLRQRHGVQVQHAPSSVAPQAAPHPKRQFDPLQRTLSLSASLAPSQQVFQLATQLALLEHADTIDALIAEHAPLAQDRAAQRLTRLGLANYFAGALLLPYTTFLQSAEALGYDIELLGQQFGVGFETVCHRLSTLQRPEAPGVPFFFVRVDRAGNISKRQSATHFHFSRTGGTCPLWNVYEAFGQPGRILAQLASMPDSRTYLWVARTIGSGGRGWGAPRKVFSIGLGCDVRHAPRLVYAKGLNLNDPAAATPIGMGCKVCERAACPQRAFPFVGGSLAVDENHSGFAPYGFAPPQDMKGFG